MNITDIQRTITVMINPTMRITRIKSKVLSGKPREGAIYHLMVYESNEAANQDFRPILFDTMSIFSF